ncbi:unnamed protein product, partial [Mesorhabditis spiculigera]
MRVRDTGRTGRSTRATAEKVAKKGRDDERKSKSNKRQAPRRARLESSSEDEEPSSSAPQPTEYFTFLTREKCPTLNNFLSAYEKHQKSELEGDLLAAIQHELEAMASHAADFSRHIQLETAFMQRGVYPLSDTSQRPLPQFQYKSTSLEYSDDEVDLFAAAPEVPKEPEDQLDNWPPEHVAKRFWTWCKHDFLKPIDDKFLKAFRQSFMDPYSEETCSQLLVNEPWKHRVKAKKETPKAKKHAKLARRRSSTNGHRDVKKEESEDERISPLRGHQNPETSLQLVTNILKAYADEYKVNGDYDEGRLKLHLSSLKREANGNGLHPDMEEDSDFEPLIEKSNGVHANGHNGTNGFSNGGLDSSESEGENDEPACSPKWTNGHAIPVTKNDISNGGSIRKRRETVEDCVEEMERDTLKEAGRSIIKHLTQLGITQEDAPEIFDLSIRCEGLPTSEPGPSVSQKGRKDDEPMDEISIRLMLAQKEMLEAVMDYRKAANNVHGILESEYVYRELKSDLDKADDELIRLGSLCFREPPLPRRVANQTDMAVLTHAKQARNRAASLLYGPQHREVKWHHIDRLKSKHRNLRDTHPESSRPKSSLARVPEGDPYEITDGDYSPQSTKDTDESFIADAPKVIAKRAPKTIIESDSEPDEKMEVDEEEEEIEDTPRISRRASRHQKSISPKRSTPRLKLRVKTAPVIPYSDED